MYGRCLWPPAERALEMFQDAGLMAEVCLWQEVGPRDMTAAQYHAVVHYYGPTVRQFYPLVFDAPGFPGPTEWAHTTRVGPTWTATRWTSTAATSSTRGSRSTRWPRRP